MLYKRVGDAEEIMLLAFQLAIKISGSYPLEDEG